MFITRADIVTDELLNAFEHLLPQLKPSIPLPAQNEIKALVESDSSQLIVARYPDETAPIVGILTLIIYRVPTAIRARIEDVVVDESMRKKGVGEALMSYALESARKAGADGVALTSNPRREAANRLYQRIGFHLWKTNLYFYKL